MVKDMSLSTKGPVEECLYSTLHISICPLLGQSGGGLDDIGIVSKGASGSSLL